MILPMKKSVERFTWRVQEASISYQRKEVDNDLQELSKLRDALVERSTGGGTEANGSTSTMYCSHCYQQGRITLPDITVHQMIDLVKGTMKEMYIPGFPTYFMTKNIPKLKRWAE
jgi:hypothetical protein